MSAIKKRILSVKKDYASAMMPVYIGMKKPLYVVCSFLIKKQKIKKKIYHLIILSYFKLSPKTKYK